MFCFEWLIKSTIINIITGSTYHVKKKEQYYKNVDYIKEIKEVTKKYIAIAKARWVAFKGSVKASIRDIKNRFKKAK